MDLNLISNQHNVDVAVFIQINHQGQGNPLPMPEEQRICLCSALRRKLMMNYSVYQVTPINEPADGTVSIPEDVFFGFSGW